MKRIIVAITGASGSLYGLTLVRTLVSMEHPVDLILTPMGEKVLDYECEVRKEELPAEVKIHGIHDLFSPLASGSYPTGGMVVVPCSMNTLGQIANGTGDNLLARTAQVCLKERRPLILVPRETPYNMIFLENMLRVQRAGAVVLPASPGFYHHPQTIEDLVNHIVGRVLDQLGLEHSLYQRWEGI